MTWRASIGFKGYAGPIFAEADRLVGEIFETDQADLEASCRPIWETGVSLSTTEAKVRLNLHQELASLSTDFNCQYKDMSEWRIEMEMYMI